MVGKENKDQIYIWCEKVKAQGNEGKRNLIKNNNFIYF